MVESMRNASGGGLAEECGEDIGLKQTGVTYLARTDKEMAGFARFLKIAETHGVDTRLLDQGETARLIPAMSRSFKGAMTTPSDMRAEPWVAVPALARLAARQGVTIIENCAARLLDISAGRISGVWTEQGRIATSNAVVASGAWTSLFLRAHGVSIPQLSVRATVAATAPMPEIHAGAVADDHIAFRRRQDGGYTLASGGSNQLYVGPDAFRHARKYVSALMANPFGTHYLPAAPRGFPDSWLTPRRWNADEESPFERMRILNPAPKASALRDIDREFTALFPQFKTVPLKASRAGIDRRDADVVPIVDRAGRGPRLVAAHLRGRRPRLRHPTRPMGSVVSDLVQGNEIGHNLHRFRQSRFSDGSPIELGPSL